MKKRAFTLIEVVTTLSLFSLMVVVVLSWFWSVRKIETHLDTKKEVLHSLVTTHRKIDALFNHTRESKKERPYLYSSTHPYQQESPGSLVFHYDRGIQPLPEFSGVVLGKLYHDPQEKALKLMLWPLAKEALQVPQQSHCFTLLKNVDKATFSFYHAPQFGRPVDPKEVGALHPMEEWQEEWKYDYRQLPDLICLKLTIQNQEIPLMFDLETPIEVEA